MKQLIFLFLTAVFHLSLSAAELPSFKADASNGGFKKFVPVSGDWRTTQAGLQEFSDRLDKRAVIRSSGAYFGPNSSLTIVAQPFDTKGETWIDFGCSGKNDFLRLVHDSATTTTVSLYRVKNGKKQLLAEINGMKQAVESGDSKHFLHFKITASRDAIQVRLNKTDLFCVHCPDIPRGGIELGVRGRKQLFKYVSARTYPKVTLYMNPAVVEDFELKIGQDQLRHSFYRDEKTRLQMTFVNRTDRSVPVRQAAATLPDGSKVSLPDAEVGPCGSKTWELPIDGADWEGECKVKFDAVTGTRKLHTDYPLFFGDRRKRGGHIFSADNIPPTLYMLDFVHRNGANCFSFSMTPYGDFEKQRNILALLNDEAIRRDMVIKIRFSVMMSVDPAKPNLLVKTPDRKKGKTLNCNDPEAQEYALDCSERLAKILLDYPAFRYILLNSEIENFLTLSDTPADKKRYEKAFGRPMPKLEAASADIDSTDGVVLKVPEKIKKDMPPVVPVDNIWYQWMTFLWKKGFGDNLLHARIVKAMKRINPALETTHEPFRDYPVFDRNLGVDYCGTWFYMAPDAGHAFMAIQAPLASMGGKKQKIEFCPSYHQYWWQFCPGKTPHIGTPPENFCMEAFFLGLSARADAFLVFSYTFMLPETKLDYRQKTLLGKTRDFSENMVAPLWPAIRPMQREKTPVSMLLSSAGQIFGSRKWGGYGHLPENEMLNLLWKANLPSNIIFEDTIRQNDDWKESKLLVIATAKFLPEDVYREICGYAKKGGHVLACAPFDKLIPNADRLDIDFDFCTKASLYSIRRQNSPWTALKAQAYRLDAAKKLRIKYHSLAPVFADPDSVEVYARTLLDADSRFVFVLNDKRTEGDYMGKKFHAVLDAGVPQKAAVLLAAESGAVYEFPAGKRLNAAKENGKLKLDLDFAPTEGKVLFCYPEALGKLTVTAGKDHTADIALTDAKGKAFRGAVPVRIRWTDPAGKVRTGYDVIRSGRLQVSVRPGRNIPEGSWKCQVTELASGMSAEALWK